MSNRSSPPPQVPTQISPFRSWMIEVTKLLLRLRESSGTFLYTSKSYPSKRLSPSLVPNHMKPCLSRRIQVTLLWDNPASVPIWENFKFPDCGWPENPASNKRKSGYWTSLIIDD